MPFRALVFSKSAETNAALTTACRSAGIRVESCTDIFSAIEKGTKQALSCVLADWSDQPEAGFLLKRSRESGPTKGLVAIAIVDNDPTAAEIRDQRLDFLIYRPIDAGEALEVLAKASQKMQEVNTESMVDTPEPVEQLRDTASSPGAADLPESQDQSQQAEATASAEAVPADAADSGDGEIEVGEEEPHARSHAFAFRQACAVALALAAVFFLWRARGVIVYLARTPEGRVNVLRESVSALFYLNPSGAMPVGAASTDAQQDAYFSRSGASPAAQTPQLGVAASVDDLSGSHIQLRKASDFPLPTPVYEKPKPEPVHVQNASIPESLRGSAPITPPVIVTVNPAQMMPVSAPAVPPPASTQQFSEPVSVSEEVQRALLIQSVNPAYPQEAMAQKLHGPVVLQATIGRDGSVEDLKIVRGYFILGRAAIAAVKQWRFQPYTLNGRAAQTQTVITVNFIYPPS